MKFVEVKDDNVKPPNKQLYCNSQLASLFADSPQAEQDLAERFFNQRLPNLAILHEKPEHRLLLLLKLRGLSNNEIAAESGYTVPWISQLMRQPWAVAMMSRMMTETGQDSIRGILQSEAVPSIMKLVALRDDPDAPATVQKSACDSLLDRYLGKPAQHIDVVETRAGMDAESVAEVDKEIARLKEEEKQLLGHN